MTPKEKALAIATALAERKGIDIRIFDLAKVSSFTDLFVIATGTSDRHVKTLAEAVIETMRGRREKPLGVEGERLGRWLLVDLGDVVVHLFDEEARAYYALERLWSDATPVEFSDPGAARRAAGAAGRAG